MEVNGFGLLNFSLKTGWKSPCFEVQQLDFESSSSPLLFSGWTSLINVVFQDLSG